MSEELPKGYDPHGVETKWRKHWRDEKTFTPDPDAPGDPYSIVIPPPNVTGALHIGHALNLTLIDSLCRHYRQKGRNVLWVPGTDHAGIATQNVVERALAKEGKRRQDLGREKFIERVWAWREEYGNRILNQIDAMGCSVDWTRLRFTMDEGLSRAVRKVFVQLYRDGLIYRGKYIINWCSRCHTALADDEVEHTDVKGSLWKIRYHLADSDQSVVIATTRPETIPGDTAICVPTMNATGIWSEKPLLCPSAAAIFRLSRTAMSIVSSARVPLRSLLAMTITTGLLERTITSSSSRLSTKTAS
jgi:valyl-tRNA synthetase